MQSNDDLYVETVREIAQYPERWHGLATDQIIDIGQYIANNPNSSNNKDWIDHMNLIFYLLREKREKNERSNETGDTKRSE